MFIDVSNVVGGRVDSLVVTSDHSVVLIDVVLGNLLLTWYVGRGTYLKTLRTGSALDEI